MLKVPLEFEMPVYRERSSRLTFIVACLTGLLGLLMLVA
jgi:hypothetical protein